MVSAGFRNKDADRLLRQVQGFNRQKEIWICFDPDWRALPEVIGNQHWQHVKSAIIMRNRLVHGLQTYTLDDCEEMANNILELLDQTVRAFQETYGYNGWDSVSIRRKATLHSDPKVIPWGMR